MKETNDTPCYLEFGDRKLIDADEFNVPVHCYIVDPWPGEKYYHWFAHNYLTECRRADEDEYHIAAIEKKEILMAVRKYVVPLYQSAMKSLAKTGELKWR